IELRENAAFVSSASAASIDLARTKKRILFRPVGVSRLFLKRFELSAAVERFERLERLSEGQAIGTTGTQRSSGTAGTDQSLFYTLMSTRLAAQGLVSRKSQLFIQS